MVFKNMLAIALLASVAVALTSVDPCTLHCPINSAYRLGPCVKMATSGEEIQTCFNAFSNGNCASDEIKCSNLSLPSASSPTTSPASSPTTSPASSPTNDTCNDYCVGAWGECQAIGVDDFSCHKKLLGTDDCPASTILCDSVAPASGNSTCTTCSGGSSGPCIHPSTYSQYATDPKSNFCVDYVNGVCPTGTYHCDSVSGTFLRAKAAELMDF